MFVNGTLIGSATNDPNTYVQTGMTIGNAGSSQFFPGYISNLRVVKGTALYTSTFTPPTAPLAAVANTVLLTCQSPMFADNSSNNLTITASSNTVKPTIVSP